MTTPNTREPVYEVVTYVDRIDIIDGAEVHTRELTMSTEIDAAGPEQALELATSIPWSGTGLSGSDQGIRDTPEAAVYGSAILSGPRPGIAAAIAERDALQREVADYVEAEKVWLAEDERLRTALGATRTLCGETDAKLTKVRAENARLREALERIAAEEAAVHPVSALGRVRAIARAALNQENPDESR